MASTEAEVRDPEQLEREKRAAALLKITPQARRRLLETLDALKQNPKLESVAECMQEMVDTAKEALQQKQRKVDELWAQRPGRKRHVHVSKQHQAELVAGYLAVEKLRLKYLLAHNLRRLPNRVAQDFATVQQALCLPQSVETIRKHAHDYELLAKGTLDDVQNHRVMGKRKRPEPDPTMSDFWTSRPEHGNSKWTPDIQATIYEYFTMTLPSGVQTTKLCTQYVNETHGVNLSEQTVGRYILQMPHVKRMSRVTHALTEFDRMWRLHDVLRHITPVERGELVLLLRGVENVIVVHVDEMTVLAHRVGGDRKRIQLICVPPSDTPSHSHANHPPNVSAFVAVSEPYAVRREDGNVTVFDGRVHLETNAYTTTRKVTKKARASSAAMTLAYEEGERTVGGNRSYGGFTEFDLNFQLRKTIDNVISQVPEEYRPQQVFQLVEGSQKNKRVVQIPAQIRLDIRLDGSGTHRSAMKPGGVVDTIKEHYKTQGWEVRITRQPAYTPTLNYCDLNIISVLKKLETEELGAWWLAQADRVLNDKQLEKQWKKGVMAAKEQSAVTKLIHEALVKAWGRITCSHLCSMRDALTAAQLQILYDLGRDGDRDRFRQRDYRSRAERRAAESVANFPVPVPEFDPGRMGPGVQRMQCSIVPMDVYQKAVAELLEHHEAAGYWTAAWARKTNHPSILDTLPFVPEGLGAAGASMMDES